jgi:hypothetical protein
MGSTSASDELMEAKSSRSGGDVQPVPLCRTPPAVCALPARVRALGQPCLDPRHPAEPHRETSDGDLAPDPRRPPPTNLPRSLSPWKRAGQAGSLPCGHDKQRESSVCVVALLPRPGAHGRSSAPRGGGARESTALSGTAARSASAPRSPPRPTQTCSAAGFRAARAALPREPVPAPARARVRPPAC